MPKTTKNFLFSKLASSQAMAFDGVSAGDFVDMWGRPVLIKREELATFVANTQANIAMTADAHGEIVGLPIDWMNHNHQEAAGWITAVALDEKRGVVLCTPRWNELGERLISTDQVRYFSPELEMKAKAIMGGSLTNWPATRTRNQQILLRPIALSQLSAVTVDESLDEAVMRVKRAFSEYSNSWYVYAVEVFGDYLIACDDDEEKMYKVSYAEGASGLEFAPREEWSEVRKAWVEMALQAAKEFLHNVFNGLGGAKPPEVDSIQEVSKPEGNRMADFANLTAEERQSAITQLLSGSNPSAELAAVVETQAREMAARLLAAEQRKQRIHGLALALRGGTAEAPRGLPLESDEIEALLNDPTAERVEAALSAIQAKGLIAFEELGHSRQLTGQHELPVEIVAKLDSKEMTLADLAHPILGLGDLAQYNLSKWQK